MPKILVIDDNKDNLFLIGHLLSSLINDSEVIIAQTGIEGIEKAKSELPDTIILDIMMPMVDGFEVCSKLKSDQTTARIPIIIVTAIRTETESRIKALNSG